MRFGAGTGSASGFKHPQERPSQGKLTGVKAGGTVPANKARPSSSESYVDRSDGDVANEIERGSRVRHAKFGEGDVLQVEPGRPPKITVKFDHFGVKQVVASFLEPG